MGEKEYIKSLVSETALLLENCHEYDWALTVRSLGDEILSTDYDVRKTVIRKYLRIFAGSGSFSDLVLTFNGETPIESNTRFSILREEIRKTLLKML